MIKTAISLAMLCVAACSSVPVGTLLTMSRFDPMTTDFSGFAARVELSEALEVPKGGATIALSAEKEDGAQLNTVVEMQQKQAIPAIKGTTRELFFSLTETDVARIDRFRDQVRQWKAAGHEVKGSVTISVAGCSTGPVPDGPLPISIWLKPNDVDGYLPFQKNVDLRELNRSAGLPSEPDICANL